MKLQPIDMEDKPCSEKKHRLPGVVLRERHAQLRSGWKLVGDEVLQKEYKFPDFQTALEFTNRIGEVAEKLNHHPDISLTYGQVGIKISTHSAGGLTECDFRLAAKIGELKYSTPGAADVPLL